MGKNMKKTIVNLSGPNVEVSVESPDGMVVTETIKNKAIDVVVADLGVSREVARKFLIEYVGANLRNIDNPDAAEADFLGRLMEAVKQQDAWATACLSVFAGKLLPQVEKAVATAKESGQDAATAVSVSMGMPMEAAKSFVVCVGLTRNGLTGEQITEIILAGLRGEDTAEIAARYGITDDMVSGQ